MSLPIIETLYHGTVYQINTIDVTKGRNNKDFGQGFYMATSRNQAIGIMHKKYREITNRIENKQIKSSKIKLSCIIKILKKNKIIFKYQELEN